VNARAVLLSGPAGVGKTTLARLVADEHGEYNVQEMNASDARSKSVLEKMLKGIGSHAALDLSMYRKGPDGKIGSAAPQKIGSSLKGTVVIMDEVDAMASRDLKALVELIKESKNPVICICNDPMQQSLRSIIASTCGSRSHPSSRSLSASGRSAARKGSVPSNPKLWRRWWRAAEVRPLLNQLQMAATCMQYASGSTLILFGAGHASGGVLGMQAARQVLRVACSRQGDGMRAAFAGPEARGRRWRHGALLRLQHAHRAAHARTGSDGPGR